MVIEPHPPFAVEADFIPQAPQNAYPRLSLPGSQFIELALGGGVVSHVLHSLLAFMPSWSETTSNPRLLSYRTYLHGHMFFVKSLCSHTLSVVVRLESD